MNADLAESLGLSQKKKFGAGFNVYFGPDGYDNTDLEVQPTGLSAQVAQSYRDLRDVLGVKSLAPQTKKRTGYVSY